MIHILAGVDPAPIGISPYLPAFYEAAAFRAGDLGFARAEFSIHTLPQVYRQGYPGRFPGRGYGKPAPAQSMPSPLMIIKRLPRFH